MPMSGCREAVARPSRSGGAGVIPCYVVRARTACSHGSVAKGPGRVRYYDASWRLIIRC